MTGSFVIGIFSVLNNTSQLQEVDTLEFRVGGCFFIPQLTSSFVLIYCHPIKKSAVQSATGVKEPYHIFATNNIKKITKFSIDAQSL